MISNKEIGAWVTGPEELRRLQRLIVFRLGHDAKDPEHSVCAAELEDMQRMQRFRDAELREANQRDAACFVGLRRTCAAVLENLLRMQRDR